MKKKKKSNRNPMSRLSSRNFPPLGGPQSCCSASWPQNPSYSFMCVQIMVYFHVLRLPLATHLLISLPFSLQHQTHRPIRRLLTPSLLRRILRHQTSAQTPSTTPHFPRQPHLRRRATHHRSWCRNFHPSKTCKGITLCWHEWRVLVRYRY